jgi:hypothetical protein
LIGIRNRVAAAGSNCAQQNEPGIVPLIKFALFAAVFGVTLVLTACGSPSHPLQPSTVYHPPEAGAACTELGCPLSYAPPPALLTATEELQREFDRCLAIGSSANCAQEAFAVVRKTKDLDASTPTGTVTVRQVPPAATTTTTAAPPPDPR